MMPWNVGTSSTHMGVQNTVKEFLPKERKNKGPLPTASEGKNPTPNPVKPIGH